MAFDADFVIVYANPAAAVLLRAPIDELVGSSALPFVHDDDLVRVASNIAAVREGIQPRAGMMQFVLRDGAVIACDITPMHLDAPEPPDGPGALTVVQIRDTALPDAHWHFLGALSSGAGFHQALADFADGVSGAVDGVLSIVYDDEHGRQVVARVAPVLLGVADDGAIDESPGSPWHEALTTGDPVVRHRDQLPDHLRAEADAIGASVCVVVPVPDPAYDRPALLIQWAADEPMGAVLREALLRRPFDAVKIALERRYTEQRLVHLAHHDDLTGLANRTRFFDRLTELRDGGHPFGVCYLDLDGFKPVNDTFGHRRGDDALAACAARLRHSARAEDLVARLGGDEFGVACPGVDDLETLAGIATRLIEALSEPLVLAGDHLHLGASAGCALGAPGADPDTVVGAADAALYEAKRGGRGTVRSATG